MTTKARPELELISGRTNTVGGLPVRRLLPTRARRAVGPFVFLDEMGPHDVPAGGNPDVLPHPHIGLATVSYLFEGELVHRDSLGSVARLGPGELNWMTAGRGIVHSERAPPDLAQRGFRLHGLQSWVALPQGLEEQPPSFVHHPRSDLPEVAHAGGTLCVLAGSAHGARSPVKTASPLFYVDATLSRGSALELEAEYEERAVYVVQGALRVLDSRASAGTLVVFDAQAEVVLEVESDARFVLLGGAPLDGPRYMDWNLVSSSKQRLAEAKREWQAQRRDGRFLLIAGDEREFVPWPDR